MAENNVEEMIDKISDEIDNVKTFLLEAKQSALFGSYDDAKHFLNKAEQISTCSYCRNKLLKFIADVEHIKSLCSLNDSSCIEDKDTLVSEISRFYDKLPSIAEIRRNKALHPSDEDPMKAIWEGLMSPVNAVTSTWDALMKSIFDQK